VYITNYYIYSENFRLIPDLFICTVIVNITCLVMLLFDGIQKKGVSKVQ